MGSRILPPLAAFLFLAPALALLPAQTADAQASASPLYLALGDSLAFGVGAESPEDDGYVALTARTMRESDQFRESGLDVLNLSSPGAETADLLAPDGQLDRALEEIRARAGDGVLGNEVAIISVSAGANDLLALAEPESPCIENAGSEACRVGLTETLTNVQENLSEVLEQLHLARIESETTLQADIFVVNLYNPYSGTGEEFEILASVGVQQLNGVIGVAAAAANEQFGAVFIVPIFELFQGRSRQWISQDEIHPNNDGYRVITEALLAAIERRPVAIPEDLLAFPTETPPVVELVRERGVDTIVLYIALPVVFLAGVALSSAYFVMRRG